MSDVLHRDLASGMEPALAEARFHMRRLEEAFQRGCGDRDKALRARVARASGVPESYLVRLYRRADEMTDVSGKYARLLRLACERLDAAAARANQREERATHERLAIRRELARGRSPSRVGGAQASLFEGMEGGRQGRP